MNEQADKASLYRTIWRWHFYAGLFVVPMVLILAPTRAALPDFRTAPITIGVAS